MAVVNKAAIGMIERKVAYKALFPRSRNAIDKKIGRAKGGGVLAYTVTPLDADEIGFEDGEWINRRVSAREASAMLLAALARWHPERVMV